MTQEVHVFAGPIAEDLRLARPAATEAELQAALIAVGAHTWVDALPDGLATVVGDARVATGTGPYAALWAAWSTSRSVDSTPEDQST